MSNLNYKKEQKIKVIGTGAIYTKYNSACTLINNELIVDMPNGTLKQLLKMNIKPENIKTIIITHLHGEHTADLPFFFEYVFEFLKDKREITVIGPKGIKNKIVELSNAYNFENEEEINKNFNLKYIEFEEEKENANILDYKIEAVKVIHGKEKIAYGYIINQKLGFTGDCGMCDGAKYIFKNSKIVVSDCSSKNINNTHLEIDEIKQIQDKAKVYCTHMLDRTRERLQKENIENFIIGKDGDEFEI